MQFSFGSKLKRNYVILPFKNVTEREYFIDLKKRSQYLFPIGNFAFLKQPTVLSSIVNEPFLLCSPNFFFKLPLICRYTKYKVYFVPSILSEPKIANHELLYQSLRLL